VETHNVYHRDRMVQVGPYFVHKNIYDGYFYPPKPEDYEPDDASLGKKKTILLVVGLLLVGVGIGFLIPV
jgi:hypothetical protein